MTEAIQTVAELTPIAAIIILAGIAATILTQIAKRPGWTAARSQTAALAVSVVLGLVAYVVSGVATVFPESLVEVVSIAVVVIAGVALMSRAAYALIGRPVPDGCETLPAEQGADGVYEVPVHWRRADRDGVPGGKDTPPDAATRRAVHGPGDVPVPPLPGPLLRPGRPRRVRGRTPPRRALSSANAPTYWPPDGPAGGGVSSCQDPAGAAAVLVRHRHRALAPERPHPVAGPAAPCRVPAAVRAGAAADLPALPRPSLPTRAGTGVGVGPAGRGADQVDAHGRRACASGQTVKPLRSVRAQSY